MLSLLLAMAMVCTMLPAAMAYNSVEVSAERDYPTRSTVSLDKDEYEDEEFSVDVEVTDDEDGDVYADSDISCEWVLYDEGNDEVDDDFGDDTDEYYLPNDLDEGSYELWCTVTAEYDGEEDSDDVVWYIEIGDGDAEEEDIDLETDEDEEFYFYSKVDNTVYDKITDLLDKYDDNYDSDLDDEYYVDFSGEYGDATLMSDDENVDENQPYLEELDSVYLSIDDEDAEEWSCDYTVYDDVGDPVLTGELTVTFDGSGYADEDIELTVDTEDEEFYFDDDDTDEGDSVQDAIIEVIDNELKDGYNSKHYYYVDFDEDSRSDAELKAERGYDYDDVDLDDLGKIYLSIGDDESWDGSYTVYETTVKGSYDKDDEILSGSLTINFGGTGVGGDIVYTATAGDEVELDIDDLEEFWDSYTKGKGSLQNVKFNSVSGVSGTLCYQHDEDGRSGHTDAEGETYYVNASRNQDELEDLTFCPSKRSSSSKYPTGTATIRFTATGTTGRGSSRTDKASGTITILYTAGDVDSIDYAASSSHIFLDKEDFDEVYKDVTDTSSRNPNYSIKFLDVPTFGTIYLNARESRGSVSGTELTSRNKNQSISRSAIDKIAYEPGVRGMGDVVRYAVYSGGDLKYMGTINFGVTAPEIHYTCAGGRVTFQAVDFYQSASMLSSSISFGAPTSGGLYKNYTGVSGTRVTSSDRFSLYGTVDSIATVSYVPVPGFSGLVEIPFTSYTTGGGRVNGVVKITVTAVTNVAFSDVPSTHWAANDIGRLAGLGIIKGTSNNTFSPNANVKYGEALKMILMAAGYPDQGNSTTGHWASNYLTLAKSKGIVSGNVDLNAEIDRNTMAALAAKALGMEKAYSVNFGVMKPCDTTDGYVYALYNAGILKGNTAGGLNYFYGNQKFTRAEQAAVVCRMLDYKNK